MPLTDTLPSFFRAEYDRFMGGLAELARPDQERLIAATRRDREDASKPRLVEIPAWDDVLHLRPRLTLTTEQRDEYYAARRGRRAAALAPEVIQEIERRRARMESMRRTAQPAFDRAWGSTMTATDNVQDFLGAVSVFGRIALKVAPRLGVYLIPGLGPLVAAAHVLSLAMLIGQFAFPAWLLICSGLRPALRAGLGTALTATVFRTTTKGAARLSAKSLTWTARGGPLTRRISGLIGAALVVTQTTDQLFGVGLSLGPIVGTTMGTAYGLEARARGEAVELRATPSAVHFWPRVRDRLRDLSTPALYERMRAAAVWEQAALVLDPASPATDEERVATLAALVPALSVLLEDWRGTGWQEELPRLEGWRPAPPTRAIARPSWQDFAEPGTEISVAEWPRTWGGASYDPPRAASALLEAIPAGLERAAATRSNLAEPSFIGAATLDATEALWLLLSDDAASFRGELTPAWKAAERMTAVGFLPHPGQDPAAVQPWWDAALARVENSRHGMQTLEEWKVLADSHRVDYLVARAPSYSE